ncbi:MAG: hypothetical protein JW702_09105 [Clostridiales bacterium]|nr:hypothetical protein [Clostridiales bacterium]
MHRYPVKFEGIEITVFQEVLLLAIESFWRDKQRSPRLRELGKLLARDTGVLYDGLQRLRDKGLVKRKIKNIPGYIETSRMVVRGRNGGLVVLWG